MFCVVFLSVCREKLPEEQEFVLVGDVSELQAQAEAATAEANTANAANGAAGDNQQGMTTLRKF